MFGIVDQQTFSQSQKLLLQKLNVKKQPNEVGGKGVKYTLCNPAASKVAPISINALWDFVNIQSECQVYQTANVNMASLDSVIWQKMPTL